MVHLDLVFVGFGNVARRTVTLLGELAARLPFDWRAVAIITGRHGATFASGGLDTTRCAGLVARGDRLEGGPQELPIVLARSAAAAREGRLVCVETTVLDIRAGEPASSHVKTALGAGAHVITANKGPVAFAYRDLAHIARGASREFLFEGAVMDGIPVFNLVRETLPAVRIDGFRGVVNSTTNHILTMLERGQTFEQALAEMQRQGIAEADPSLDVDGWDAAAKTAALMNVLMDGRVTPHDIDREGIRGVSGEAVREVRDQGQRLRLVASAERGALPGRVHLETVPADDPLGRLDGMQNALILKTDLLGEIGIVQRDGGLTQTAYALVSDLVRIARRLGGGRLPPSRKASADRRSLGGGG